MNRKICISLLVVVLVNMCSFLANFSDTLPIWVQAGIFKEESAADLLTTQLIQDGYDPIWSKDGFISVRLGPYTSKEEASRLIAELKTKSYKSLEIITDEIVIEEEVNEEKTIDEIITDLDIRSSKNYFIGSDIRMEGVMGSHTIFVSIDEHWELKDSAFIEVFYTTSVISEYDFSTMTVYVNNNPIESFWINDKIPGTKKLTIDLPIKYLNEGFNNVSFVSYHRLTDNICEDDANQANWILLGKETRVHIEYEELPDNDNLLDFPYPFIKTSRDLPIDFIMMLPDTPRDIDIEASLMFSTYVGKVNRFSNVNYHVKSYSEAPKELNNLIWISSSDAIPSTLKNEFTESDLNRLKTDALIRKAPSPYNENKKILCIVSDDPDRLIDAVTALTDQVLVDQMDNNTQWFTEDTVISEKVIEESDYIDLKSLGYGNILFQGRKRGSASAFIDIPPTWVVTDDAKILVKFRYSDILDFEKSSMSIYINNIPVGSKGFNEDFVQDDTIVLPIPEDVRQDQTYEVRFDMSLITVNEDCESASFDRNLWGFISNETVLYLPHEERDIYSFERYPAPFVKNSRMNDLLIVLPDEIDFEAIQYASEILSLVGRDLTSIESLKIAHGSDFTETDYDNNIIAIGAWTDNAFIRKINSELNIKYAEDLKTFERTDKLELLDGFNDRVGTAQLIYSPFQEGRMIMAITGTSKESIGFVSKYLSDLELFERLIGDTAFVSGSGALRTDFIGLARSEFETLESEQFSDGRDSDLERKLTSREIQQFVLTVVLVFIVVILSVIVAARARRHESKK